MTRRLRTGVFLVGVAGFAALLGWGFAGLPDFGHYVGPYGNVIVEVVKPQRHIANAVTAVVFDYRGFDTMGEELILFAAFTGIAILLRETREHDVRDIVDAVHSDAVEAVGLVAVPVTFVLALYVIAHGYLSPGGGFQGGVVVSAAFLLVFLTGEYRGYLSVAPATAWEAADVRARLPAELHGSRDVREPDVVRKRGPRELVVRARRRRGLCPDLRRVPAGGDGAEAREGQSVSWLPYALSAWIFCVGLYGIVRSRNLIHLAVCVSVVQSSTYVLLLSVGYKKGGTAPVFTDIPFRRTTVDPVVQALTLTDIVVSVVVFGLLLTLAMESFRNRGTLDPAELADMQG